MKSELKFSVGIACISAIIVGVGLLIFTSCGTVGYGSSSPRKYSTETAEKYRQKRKLNKETQPIDTQQVVVDTLIEEEK